MSVLALGILGLLGLAFLAYRAFWGGEAPAEGPEAKAALVAAPTTPVIEREDVRATLSVGGARGPGWSALRLRVSNRGTDFRGTLEVRGVDGTWESPVFDPMTYRMSLEVPGGAGAAREVTIPVRAEGWGALLLAFRDTDGYEQVLKLELPADDGKRPILAIGESPGDLSQLLARSSPATGPKGGKRKKAAAPPERPREPEVIKASERDLPAHAASYGPFRLVVLFGASFAEAREGTLEALVRWVEAGGTLVAFPGPAWTSGMPQRLRELLSCEPAGSAAPFPPELAARAGAGTGWPGLYLPLRAGPGARELEGGLAYASRFGAGSVTAFTVAPSGEELPSAKDAPGLHAALEPALRRAASPLGSWERTLAALEGEALDQLGSMSSFHVPSRSEVALGLLLYLALGFLLPAAVFRALRRPAWTYLAVAAAALASSVAVYRYGLLFASEATELNEVTVLRLHPGGKTAEATSFLGLKAPYSERVDLHDERAEAGGASAGASPSPLDALPWPLEPRGAGAAGQAPDDTPDWLAPLIEDERVLIADRAGRLRLPPVALRPNRTRFFRFDYRVEVERGLLESAAPASAPRKAMAQILAGLHGETNNLYVSSAPIFPGAAAASVRRAVTIVVLEE
ncbi:MAG: hypothetical protein HY721_13980 [Planctomycetes bacterium]|nr:hypothetical protein [Planctomycetota bacterium]